MQQPEFVVNPRPFAVCLFPASLSALNFTNKGEKPIATFASLGADPVEHMWDSFHGWTQMNVL